MYSGLQLCVLKQCLSGNDSSEDELMFTEPAASTAKRSITQPVKQQTQSGNGPQSPTKRSAKTAKHRPDLSDEHLITY